MIYVMSPLFDLLRLMDNATKLTICAARRLDTDIVFSIRPVNTDECCELRMLELF